MFEEIIWGITGIEMVYCGIGLFAIVSIIYVLKNEYWH